MTGDYFKALTRTAWLLAGSLPLAGPAWAQGIEISTDIPVKVNGGFVDDHQVFVGGSSNPVGLPVGLAGGATDVDAYQRLSGGEQLYSTNHSITLAGGILAQRGDVVHYDGNSESLAFDASAVGLPASADVDAITVNDTGDLVLSFASTLEFGGSTFGREDLASFDGATFSLLFDGSAEGVPGALNLDAAALRLSDGHLLLSFDSSGVIDGVFFDDEDVVEFDPTGGSWSLLYDASAQDLAMRTTDVVAVPEPGSVWLGGAALASLFLLSLIRRR